MHMALPRVSQSVVAMLAAPAQRIAEKISRPDVRQAAPDEHWVDK
jgi:hypothetical protein